MAQLSTLGGTRDDHYEHHLEDCIVCLTVTFRCRHYLSVGGQDTCKFCDSSQCDCQRCLFAGGYSFGADILWILGLVYFCKMRDVPPNKSPEPTAVGACSSAIAVHVASRRWLSFFR